MGLELLAATAALPETREVARVRGEAVRRPAAPPERLALDAALSVCQSALQRACCTSADLGLLLSKGVSPSHVALSPAIVGPRLAHPLQHALGASQAFVFDLLDSPWVAALDTAEVFLQDLGRDLALLVHSENGAASVDPDPSSGFAISDGVGVLLLRRTPDHSARASFVPVRTATAPAQVLVNAAGSARRTRLCFDAGEELALAVRAAMLQALERQLELLNGRDAPLVLAEQWFPGHTPDIELCTLRGSQPADVCLGPLSVPEALARHGAAREQARRPLLILGFDPFRLQVSCRSILASLS